MTQAQYSETALIKLDAARQALAESRDLSEIKAIRDQAEAMRQYAKAAQMGLEAQNHAAEIKLRAERRAGELLGEMDRQPRGRPEKTSPDVTFTVEPIARPTLTDIGVTRMQSHRWQAVAAVPEPVFEQHVAEVRGKPEGEITSSAVVDIGRKYQAERRASAREAKEQAREEEPMPEIPFDIEVADAGDMPLDSNTIDLIVTSPPYGLDKPYAGVSDPSNGWREFMVDWLGEAYRVATDGGRLALNVPLDTSNPYPRPTFPEAVVAALEAGWCYRWSVVWNEGNVSRSVARGSVDSASAPHVIAPVEMIVVFHKGEWARALGDSDIKHADWLEWTNGLWTFSGESRAWEGHPAPFPVELPHRLIQLLSYRGDYVLDPFVGSGTTLVAAHRLGRYAVGYDLSSEHVESAKRRLAAEVKR